MLSSRFHNWSGIPSRWEITILKEVRLLLNWRYSKCLERLMRIFGRLKNLGELGFYLTPNPLSIVRRGGE